MQVSKEWRTIHGRRFVTVELEEDEVLVSVIRGEHYKLGQPVEDIVPSYVIEEITHVAWCSVEQKWGEV